jgi:hypothetical protein
MTCFIFDTLSVTPVVSGPPFGGMVWTVGPGSVSWDFTIPASVRLLVELLVVVWPVVSDMPIYADVYMFCVLHVLYIY